MFRTSSRAAWGAFGSAWIAARCSGVKGAAAFGSTQFAVRWKRYTWPATFTISGTNWDGARRAADHAHRLTREVVVLVPGGGVEAGAAEVVEARDVGVAEPVEHPHAAHDHVGLGHVAALGLDRPAGGALVPDGAPHGIAEAAMGQQAMLLRTTLQVGQDLRLGRIGSRPVRIELEGEGVEGSRNVAGATGIAVLVPGAADPVVALQDLGSPRSPTA